jgi:hypothetical protein
VGMTPIGALVVGYLGTALGPRKAVLICGAITLMCGVTLLTSLKAVGVPEAAAIAD